MLGQRTWRALSGSVQEVLERLTGMERPPECQKHCDPKAFNANEDYVSKLNWHMQRRSRPHAKQSVAYYEELPRSGGRHIADFSYRVLVDNRVFEGHPQPKVKAAKQAAAYAACVALGVGHL